MEADPTPGLKRERNQRAWAWPLVRLVDTYSGHGRNDSEAPYLGSVQPGGSRLRGMFGIVRVVVEERSEERVRGGGEGRKDEETILKIN